MYDIVFVTNLPSFYKINLFNRIAQKKNILVIFLKETDCQRNNDFYKGERNFKFISLANNNALIKAIKFLTLLKSINYSLIIIGGWDYIEFWIVSLLCPKKKNGLILESSVFESKTSGLKGFIKKIFISRISHIYASGKAQSDLSYALKFTGKLKITKGVGIFNYSPPLSFYKSDSVTNFLYVGRLSSEKNLEQLVKIFNSLPNLSLNIIGFGPLETHLITISKENIIFLGAIANSELFAYYRSNDVFILPSLSEPWGLVVEEALNNGIPVIVSDKVGCAPEIVRNDINGLIFDLTDKEGLKKAILKICDVDYYNSLKKNVCKIDFEKITNEQVECYL